MNIGCGEDNVDLNVWKLRPTGQPAKKPMILRKYVSDTMHIAGEIVNTISLPSIGFTSSTSCCTKVLAASVEKCVFCSDIRAGKYKEGSLELGSFPRTNREWIRGSDGYCICISCRMEAD
jgi:hypothetical protein